MEEVVYELGLEGWIEFQKVNNMGWENILGKGTDPKSQLQPAG